MTITNNTNLAQLVDVKLCTGTSQGMRELKAENNFELDPAKIQPKNCDVKISTERKRDTVIVSEKSKLSLYVDAFEVARGEFSTSGIARYCVTDALNRDNRIQFNNMFGGLKGFSAEQIAKRVADIGKEFDEAYAVGGLIEEDYTALNKELEAYCERLTSASERTMANYLARNDFAANRNDYIGETPMDVMKEMKNQYLDPNYKDNCLLDRNAIQSMINWLRYN
ncbi:MAG: hypothetical protein IJZ72_06740 [Oscillospiraceae bacterium]|nr:hypothetical protein [Oscillospiraceae bacterium]